MRARTWASLLLSVSLLFVASGLAQAAHLHTASHEHRATDCVICAFLAMGSPDVATPTAGAPAPDVLVEFVAIAADAIHVGESFLSPVSPRAPPLA